MSTKAHKDTMELSSYLNSQQSGKVISYMQIESDTGIVMNLDGKNRLRSAIKLGNILTITHKGVGIEIVSKDTCVEAVSIQFQKIGKAVYRGRCVTQGVISKHFGELDSDTRSTILVADSALGAIQANSETRVFMDSIRKKKQVSITNIDSGFNIKSLAKK